MGEAAMIIKCGTYPHPLSPSRKGRGDVVSKIAVNLTAVPPASRQRGVTPILIRVLNGYSGFAGCFFAGCVNLPAPRALCQCNGNLATEIPAFVGGCLERGAVR